MRPRASLSNFPNLFDNKNTDMLRIIRPGTYVIQSLCFLHVFHTYFYEFTETRGESMLPTLSATKDFVHVDKRYRNGKNVRLGDCIVAVKPTDPTHRVCKRISGMPGDLILVDPGVKKDLVNYSRSEEAMDDNEEFRTYIRVPKGHVWVTGDNLSHSLDSRTYNALPMGLIKGKIVAANDFNEPFWNPKTKKIWGFRKIPNTYEDFLSVD